MTKIQDSKNIISNSEIDIKGNAIIGDNNVINNLLVHVNKEGVKLESENKIIFASIELATKECLWEDLDYRKEEKKYYSCILSRFNSKDKRTTDPIFEIAILNNKTKSVLLTKIGFQAIDYWTDIKGRRTTSKIILSDAYELEVVEFQPTKDYFLKLEDQVLLEAGAAYRFKLKLKQYQRVVKGNQSIIKLSLVLNNQILRSEKIYLGL